MIGEPNLYECPEEYRNKEEPRNIEVGIKVAAAYWKDRGLNEMAEEGGLNEETVIKITKKVNGGTNGLKDRLERFWKLVNNYNSLQM